MKKLFLLVLLLIFTVGCKKNKAKLDDLKIPCGNYSPTNYINTNSDFAQFATYSYASPGNSYLQPLSGDSVLLDPLGNTAAAGCTPTSTIYNGNSFAESAKNFYTKYGKLIKQDVYNGDDKVATMSYTYSKDYPAYLAEAEKVCSSMNYEAKMHYRFFYKDGLLVKITMTGDKNCITPPAGSTKTITYEYKSTVAKMMPSKVTVSSSDTETKTTTYEYLAKDGNLSQIIYNSENSPVTMNVNYMDNYVTSLSSKMGPQEVTIKIDYKENRLSYMGDSRFPQFGLFVKYTDKNMVNSILQNTGMPGAKPVILNY